MVCSSVPTSAFAEFTLNGFELSAEVGLALRIAKLRLHILLKSLLNLCDLELRGETDLDRAHSFSDIEFFEDGLLLRDINVQIRREKIGELSGIVDAADN